MGSAEKVIRKLKKLANEVFHEDIREGIEMSIDAIRSEFGMASEDEEDEEDDSSCEYTDIGHAHPNDVIWILIGGELRHMSAGYVRTHELIWGGDVKIEDHWRGRFEVATGYCSVAWPHGSLANPPEYLVVLLNEHFKISKFYCFINDMSAAKVLDKLSFE